MILNKLRVADHGPPSDIVRNRKFESISLQQRVSKEPRAAGGHPLRGGVVSPAVIPSHGNDRARDGQPSDDAQDKTPKPPPPACIDGNEGSGRGSAIDAIPSIFAH